MRRGAGIVIGTVAVLSLGACSSDHDPTEFGRRGATTSTSTVPDTTAAASSTAPGTATTVTPGAATTAAGAASATSAPGASALHGTAVAGSAGGVEPVGGPFTQTDPFAEAVRLADGTCVGWADSRGGSTAGLAVGAPVTVLDPATSAPLGTGTITASRWEDVSGGAGQFTCFFDFSAAVPGPPAEVLVRVGDLQPWTARPDPANPASRVASVSTNAAIGLIASCPALPTTTAATTASTAAAAATAAPAATAAAGPPVTGWNAVGQYWSIGVDALCRAGLPVTALARPCRTPVQGSEYITKVVDSNHPSVTFANGAAIPAGTQLTVAVATGRPCD